MNIVSTLIEAHIFKIHDGEMEFLLLKRADNEKIYPGLWQMVTGSIEEPEKAWEAALREIKEETCLIPQHFWIVPRVNSFYNPYKDEINMIPVFAAQVQIDAKVVISQEHSEYKWVGKEEAKNLLAWKGQRNSVDIISEYFTNELNTFNFLEIDFKNV